MLKRVSHFWMASILVNIVILIIFLLMINAGLRPLYTLLINILACILANFLLYHIFVKRPLSMLAEGMNNLAEKNFEFRFDKSSDHDTEPIVSSFNDLAFMLSSSHTELDKSRDYLRGILESSEDIIITMNTSGILRTINKGVRQVLGYRPQDLIGQPMDKLFADSEDKEIITNMLKHDDSIINYEAKFLSSDGKPRDMLLTFSRLRNITGDVIGTIIFSKDITEQKRLQVELLQAQRFAAIGQVFTGIQHSMKNMLNACKGGAYMVRTGLAKDKPKMLHEGWDMVEEGINRLTGMSSDMLKYVKEWKPKSISVDLTDTLNDIYGVVRQACIDKGIDMYLDICPNMPMVSCDTGMIHSSVMDIVSNAIDACVWKDYEDNEVPEMKLSAYPDHTGANLIIEIQDNGCGMDDDIKENIFNPFFSTKSKAGTGLGLSITTRMIDVHGGEISVESELDHGSIFRIVLPVQSTDAKKENNDGEESAGR